MKKIILIIIFSLSISNLKADFWAPLFRVSYDFNLGYTTSIGISWNNTANGDIGTGAYFLYSFSHKKGRKNIEGENFSTGLYAGLGIASFRVGINNMIIKYVNNSSSRGGIHRFNNFSNKNLIQKPGSYWGFEVSPNILIGNVCLGVLDTNEGIKLNSSFGLGIF